MKTKTLSPFFLILFLFGTNSAIFSQTYSYVPIPTGNATWGMSNCSWTTADRFNVIMQGDTLINGLTYNKVYKDDLYIGYRYLMAVREDAKVVYFIHKGLSQEYILYDFTKQVGDIIELHSFEMEPPMLVGEVEVISIDLVTIDGGLRQKFTVRDYNNTNSNNYYTYEWIEGIGSTWGFDAPFMPWTDYQPSLFCHTVETDYVYSQPVPYCPVQGGTAEGGCLEPLAWVVLPLELTSFSLSKSEKSVQLDWSTANEIDFSGFSIERSTDGQNFDRIGWQDALGVDNQAMDYTFLDEAPIFNQTLYYRLKLLDIDGGVSYSDILSTIILREFSNEFDPFIIFPNPASTQITIELEMTEATFAIYNSLGQLVQSAETLSSTNRFFELSIVDLEPGVYFLVANGFSGRFLKM